LDKSPLHPTLMVLPIAAANHQDPDCAILISEKHLSHPHATSVLRRRVYGYGCNPALQFRTLNMRDHEAGQVSVPPLIPGPEEQIIAVCLETQHSGTSHKNSVNLAMEYTMLLERGDAASRVTHCQIPGPLL
jgi:hypothetical protein